MYDGTCELLKLWTAFVLLGVLVIVVSAFVIDNYF